MQAGVKNRICVQVSAYQNMVILQFACSNSCGCDILNVAKTVTNSKLQTVQSKQTKCFILVNNIYIFIFCYTSTNTFEKRGEKLMATPFQNYKIASNI